MNNEQLRAEFDAWRRKHYDYADLCAFEIEFAFDAFQAGRAALQSQEQTIPYAGVTVWVGNKRCSHGVTKDEFDLSTFDILQAAFDHARRVEGDGE